MLSYMIVKLGHCLSVFLSLFLSLSFSLKNNTDWACLRTESQERYLALGDMK